MTLFKKALTVIGLFVLSCVIGYFDTISGQVLSFNVLFLIPIVVATIYLGLAWGTIFALIVTVIILFKNLILGVSLGIELAFSVVLRFGANIFVVLIVNMLVKQYNQISILLQEKNYYLRNAKKILTKFVGPVSRSFRDYEVYAQTTFAKEIGGDYLHVIQEKDALYIFVADISGKGVPAALFTPLIDSLVKEATYKKNDPSEIIKEINAKLYRLFPEEIFVTLLCGLINNDEFVVTNAGHEPPLFYSKKKASIDFYTNDYTLPIGLKEKLEIKPIKLDFDKGDVLLIFTDGLSTNLKYKEIKNILMLAKDKNPKDIVKLMHNKIFEKKPFVEDDVVILCVKKL